MKTFKIHFSVHGYIISQVEAKDVEDLCNRDLDCCPEIKVEGTTEWQIEYDQEFIEEVEK